MEQSGWLTLRSLADCEVTLAETTTQIHGLRFSSTQFQLDGPTLAALNIWLENLSSQKQGSSLSNISFAETNDDSFLNSLVKLLEMISAQLPSIRSLDFFWLDLSKILCEDFFDVFPKFQLLTTLIFRRCFADQIVAFQFSKELSARLVTNLAIRRLALVDCQLNDAAIECLSLALIYNECVESLLLDNNQITETGCRSLATHVTYLFLCSSRLGLIFQCIGFSY